MRYVAAGQATHSKGSGARPRSHLLRLDASAPRPSRSRSVISSPMTDAQRAADLRAKRSGFLAERADADGLIWAAQFRGDQRHPRRDARRRASHSDAVRGTRECPRWRYSKVCRATWSMTSTSADCAAVASGDGRTMGTAVTVTARALRWTRSRMASVTVRIRTAGTSG